MHTGCNSDGILRRPSSGPDRRGWQADLLGRRLPYDEQCGLDRELHRHPGHVPNGATYEPGVKQRLTVTVTANTPTFGFQLSARDSNVDQAGTLASIDATTSVATSGAGIQYVRQTMLGSDGMFQSDWTPPATDIGTVTLYVAANAANGNGNASGDRIHLPSFAVEPAATMPQPTIRMDQPVLQAFDNNGRMSATERAWAHTDFVNGVAPTELDGVKVNVNNQPALVSYISKNQVNAYTASDDTAEGPVNVEVVNAAGTSNKCCRAKNRGLAGTPHRFPVREQRHRVRSGLLPGLPIICRACGPGGWRKLSACQTR